MGIAGRKVLVLLYNFGGSKNLGTWEYIVIHIKEMEIIWNTNDPLKISFIFLIFPLCALIATWPACDLVFRTNWNIVKRSSGSTKDHCSLWLVQYQVSKLERSTDDHCVTQFHLTTQSQRDQPLWSHESWPFLNIQMTVQLSSVRECFCASHSKWNSPTERDVLGWSFFSAHQCALNNWKIFLTKVKKAPGGNTKQRLVL